MAFITAEPFVVFYNLVYSINMIVLPQLVFEKSCNQLYNSTICNELHNNNKYKSEENVVQEHSSLWMLILLMSTLLPSMFTVLIWGPIADIIGRKRAMAIPPVFLGIQSVIYYLNSTKFMSSPIGYLIFGAFTTSIYGDFQGAYALAYSYMADVTEKSSKRTMRMAILEGIMFISGAPAGLISGYILQRLGFGPVFITTGSLCAAMLCYVCFILPTPQREERQSEEQDQINEDGKNEESSDSSSEEMPIICSKRSNINQNNTGMLSLNPLHHLRTVYSVITHGKRLRLLIPLLISFGLALVAIAGELYITVLYTKHRPFSLSPEQIGYYMVFMSLTRGIGAILLPQIAVRCFRCSDYVLICFGLISQTSNYILVGVANSKLMLYLVTMSGIGIGVATSGIRSLISKQVTDDSHGSVLAAIEFMDALGALLGNVISNSIYNGTVATYPGTAFFILGIFSGASLVICILCWTCNRR